MKTKKTAVKKVAKKVAKKAVAEPIAEVTPEAKDKTLKVWSVGELMSLPIEDYQPYDVQVISLANNPRYVYASLDGEKIAVEVPAWMSPRLIRKTITVVKKLDSENYEIFKDGN
jgi:hypothetical protein